ncbi:MAG: DMT family transporter [Halanaerobiales bacterium]|nr:DMT family transporter [Halanaerobiales bacterium]
MKKSDNNLFTNKILVIVFAVIACLLWGSAFPSLKVSYKLLDIDKAGPFVKMLFASYRFLLAAVMLLIFIIFKSGIKKLKLDKNDLKHLFFLGFIQTFVQYIFFYNGLANTTGVKASILVTSGIFFTVITSHFIYKDDKLNKLKIMGLILGILGVVVVNLNKADINFSFNFYGEGFIILSGVMSTIAIIYAKFLSKKISIMIITAYQMLFGSLLLFFISLLGTDYNILQFSTKSIILLVYLAFISATAFGIWYTLIKYNKVGYITIYKFIAPVSGVFLSAFFIIGETVTINAIFSLVMVSTGILTINMPQKKIIK